jgi:hypothetical protein
MSEERQLPNTPDEMLDLVYKAAMFADGAKGMRLQVFRSPEYPRLSIHVMKKTHQAPWLKFFAVDDEIIGSCGEDEVRKTVCALLNGDRP